MTPAARLQLAIELLDEVLTAARTRGPAADVLLARAFAARRFAGSKDRRAIRGLVYDAIRLCGELPESGRAAMIALAAARPDLAALFDGSQYGPPPIGEAERPAPIGVAPAWLVQALEASGLDSAECKALLDRAPLDIRVNLLKTTVEAVAAEIQGATPLAFVPAGLRLDTDAPVEGTPAYADGRFEVQDGGSQLVSHLAGAKPGMAVIDLCAGGGGKTLALAASMQGQGSVLACDIDRPRLSRLAPRAARAGVTIATTRLLKPGQEQPMLEDWRARADLVVIDAPCSGTGTWRRNPEARWRLTPQLLDHYVATQARLMEVGAALVRPGGALVYITCSLLDAEGAGQVDRFLAAHGEWNALPVAAAIGTPRGNGLRLTPHRDSTDGFFVAKMVRQC